jgi:hypothetical protein
VSDGSAPTEHHDSMLPEMAIIRSITAHLSASSPA